MGGVAAVQGRLGVQLRRRVAAHADGRNAGRHAVSVGQVQQRLFEGQVTLRRVGKLRAFVTGVPVVEDDPGQAARGVAGGADALRAGKVAVVLDGPIAYRRQRDHDDDERQAFPAAPRPVD